MAAKVAVGRGGGSGGAAASAVNLYGTLAARPAAGTTGRLYFTSDTGGLAYRDNGVSWDAVGLMSSGFSTFARTLIDDTTQLAAQTTLGVVPGTDVQVFSSGLTALGIAQAGITVGRRSLDRWRGSPHGPDTTLTIALSDTTGTAVVVANDNSTRGGTILAAAITSNGSPTFTVTHNFAVNDEVFMSNPPGGFSANTLYYVVSVTGTTTFTLSATRGGTAINATTNPGAIVMRRGVSEVFQIDTEQMLVIGGQSSVNTTVIRGINGTTAATHAAGASVIRSRIRHVCFCGDSITQGTVTGSTVGPYDSWVNRARRILGQRFGGDLGAGFQPLWRIGGLNTASEWSSSGLFVSPTYSNDYDFGPFSGYTAGAFSGTLAGAASTAITSVATTVATDTLTKTTHGLADGNLVFLSAIVSTTGITTATTYYVRDSAANTFKLCTIPGGTAVDLTGSDGTVTVTRQAVLTWTRPPNVTVAQVDVYWVDYPTNSIWSYSTDGGTTWVANPNATTNPATATLKKSSVVVTNPTTFRLRAASAANVTSSSIFSGIDIWSTVPVFGVTTGVKCHNLGQDSNALASWNRSQSFDDLVCTSGSAVITSQLAAFVAAQAGARFDNANFPAGTTIVSRDSATQCTLSNNATGSVTAGTSNPFTVTWRVGQPFSLLHGHPASLVPDLVTALFVNDGANTALLSGARVITGTITSTTALQVTSGTLTAQDTGKVVVHANIPAGTTITYVDSTHATLSAASTNGAGLSITLCNSQPQNDSAFTYNLANFHRNVTNYSDILYLNPYEMGGTRLDGSVSSSARQTANRALVDTHVSTNLAAEINLYAAYAAEGNTGYAACAADGLADPLSPTHVGITGHRDIAARITRLIESF